MTTPICDFMQKYADSDAVRLHMPGHKGVLGVEKYDITEISGADVLYSATGIIAESENNAASLFGSKRTLYSTEGSSLCIRAMLYLVNAYAKKRGQKPRILAARNAHKTFLSGVALLDLEVEWIYTEKTENMLSCKVSAEYLGACLDGMREIPTAVYITSPDYLGNTCDIGSLAKVCHDRGALLLVDNAHGAYLNFLQRSKHPMSEHADICCDSAHKTLPVLTGGAYLHLGADAPDELCYMAEQAMALFASTSPSYLILQSLDKANLYLSEGYRERLADLIRQIDALKIKLTDKGFTLIGDEALKLTLAPKSYGYTGEELAECLEKQNIICELTDRDYTVMMFTPEISDRQISRLENILLDLERRDAIFEVPPVPRRAERVVSVREAMLSCSREVATKDVCGKILASPSVSCPPAVPILICGERIDSYAVKCFEYYGIERVRVLEGV